MRRRSRHYERRQSDSQDRWLVSYADFITLLFAFFVVMYALSSVNEGKYRELTGSLLHAFGGHAKPVGPALAVAPPLVGSLPRAPGARPARPAPPARDDEAAAQNARREQMRGIAQGILQVLDALVRNGQVKVTQSNRGVSVEINASVLFAPGQAQLRAESMLALREVAAILAPLPLAVSVEGYTDNSPIVTAQFPSNWELSAARASSVVRLLGGSGVLESRLSVVGHGPNRAVQSNDSAEGRARNRRVTMMILAETPGQVVDLPLAAPSGAQPLAGPADNPSMGSTGYQGALRAPAGQRP
jgi:chemotaxis protein MotB